jgi:hypothetical protein
VTPNISVVFTDDSGKPAASIFRVEEPWDMASCSLVDIYLLFAGTCRLNFQGRRH